MIGITEPGAQQYQVVVVGAGPVGMTLAMDLGQRGVRTLVVEQSSTTTTNPRCNTTNARSMEYFRRLGVADRIRRAGLPLEHPTDVVYCTSLTGHELTRFRFSSSAEILSGEAHEFNDWPTPEPQHRISQIFLEPILEEHLSSVPDVRLLRGHRVAGVRQVGDEVIASIVDEETGESDEVTASFVIGCDGGSSTIRKSIGSRLEGDAEASERRHSIYFRSTELGALLGDRPGWMYWWYGRKFRGSVLRLDGESLFLCHARVPAGMDPEEVDSDEVLEAAVGRRIAHEKISVVRWTARRLVAERFRQGRILLAGDAAHLWLPLGGFGMNTGIADAMGMSWRLAAILQGWGGARLLDDYEAERRSIGEATSQAALKIDVDMSSIARDPELHDDTPAGEKLRTEVGRLIEQVDRKQWFSQGVQFGTQYVHSPGVAHAQDGDVTAAAIAGIEHYTPSATPGARFPHMYRRDGASVFDQLGAELTLVRVGPDAPPCDRLTAAAAELSVPVTVLDVPESEAPDIYDAPLVLVRPDLFVAWSGDQQPSDPEQLLVDLLGIDSRPGEEQRAP